MEEECGNIDRCRKLLLVGLKFLPQNENIFVKALKIEEKLGNYQMVRKLLSTLKDVHLEKSWKLLLEGALFEGRIGNKNAARKVFKYLFAQCPTYGPIYLEASKYEERSGHTFEALK